jgi:hypothetical protein
MTTKALALMTTYPIYFDTERVLFPTFSHSDLTHGQIWPQMKERIDNVHVISYATSERNHEMLDYILRNRPYKIYREYQVIFILSQELILNRMLLIARSFRLVIAKILRVFNY